MRLKFAQLLPNEIDGFRYAARSGVDLDLEIAAVARGFDAAVDAVDESALLTQLLPKTRFERAARAQNLIEHEERVVIRARTRDGRLSETDVFLCCGGADVIVAAVRRRK